MSFAQHCSSVPDSLKSALAVTAVVLVVAFMSKWCEGASRTYSSEHIRRIQTLTKEASRLMVMAGQDANPLLALMHATYGAAYLAAARTVAGDKDLEQIIGLDVDELTFYTSEGQQAAMKRLATACPAVQPTGEYAVSTGWIA